MSSHDASLGDLVADYYEVMFDNRALLRAAVDEGIVPGFFIHVDKAILVPLQEALKQDDPEAVAQLLVDVADEVQGFMMHNPTFMEFLGDLTPNQFTDIADELDNIDTETSRQLYDNMHLWISSCHGGAVIDAGMTGLPKMMVAHALNGMMASDTKI